MGLLSHLNPFHGFQLSDLDPTKILRGGPGNAIQTLLLGPKIGDRGARVGDIAAIGPFAADPTARAVGKGVGLGVGLGALGGALGAFGGSGAGESAAAAGDFAPSAAASAPAAADLSAYGVTAPAATVDFGPSFTATGAETGIAPAVSYAPGEALTGGAAGALGMPSPQTGAAPATGTPANPYAPQSDFVTAPTAPGATVPGAAAPAAATPGAAAGTAPGAAQAPISSGFKTGVGVLDKALGALNSKYAGLLLQGAGLALSASAGNKPMPNQQQFQGMGETASQAAIQNIQMAQAGQLSGPQQATLDQYTQEAKNQVRQYFSSIGQFDSTERIKAEQQVDQQAMAMKQQLIQTTLQNGIALMGAANTPLAQVANYQLGQDKNLMDAIGRFTSGAGTILGSQAGTPAKAA